MELVDLTVTTRASPSGVNPIWPGDRGNAGGFWPHWNWGVGKPPGSQFKKEPGLVPGLMIRVEPAIGFKWPFELTWKPVMFGIFPQGGDRPGPPELST